MIKIKRIDRFEDIGEKTWTEVLNSSKENYIFQTYEYTSTWWKHFGHNKKNRELLLLVVEDSGDIVAIAPLMLTILPLINKAIVQFVGTDICDYMDFIISNKNYEKYLLKILEYLSTLRFLEIDLRYVSEGSKLLENYDGSCESISGKICQVDGSPYINLQENWANIVSGLKKKLRGEISRNEKRMQKEGNLIFKCYTRELPPKKIFDDYFDLHVKKWRDYSQKYSQFQYKHWRDFITDLSLSILDRGWLDISCLELDKKMVACHFGFRYKDRFYYYMPTFDPAFAEYSPAKILIMRMMYQAHNKGLKEFDFLRGMESYKLAWTKSTRPIYNVLYYSKSALRRYPGLMYRNFRDGFTKNIKPKLKRISPLMKIWYESKGDLE